MQWISVGLLIFTALENVKYIEMKLAPGHSLKSSEMLSNTLSNDNNNINNGDILNSHMQQQQKVNEKLKLNNNKLNVIQTNQKQTNALEDFRNDEDIDVDSDDDKDKENNKVAADENKPFENAKIKSNKTIPTVTKLKSTTNSNVAPAATIDTSTPPAASKPNAKIYKMNGFINPFGQLVAFFGSDQIHLQDYNFLFNADRHTVFQLHTTVQPETAAATTNSTATLLTATGHVLNVVGSVSSTIGAAVFGAATGGGGGGGGGGVPQTKVEEVQLYNAASLRQSRFNPFNPTRILIHGWFGGSHANVFSTIIPEYLKLGTGNYNVIVVDWGRGAIADYITASYRVKSVGKVVAKFIDFLHHEAGMRFEDLHVVGFSMGAHIAGIAGKYVQTGRLPIIYALDPALQFFRYENIDERVALTDADYVEVIHTSAGSYGYDRPLGHVDFYVNYGYNQPGCFLLECSHFRAFQVFAESLHSKKSFRGQGCDVKLWQDLIKQRRCLMGTGRNLTMGGDPLDAAATKRRGGGVYYFTTNANSPYGRG